jgi:hypothetical protein
MSRTGVRATNWADRLTKFFRAREEALGYILEARGCREGWLHGELHREFRRVPGFAINHHALSDGETADLLVEGAMIGELKILGARYHPKVVTGGSLKALRRAATRTVTPLDDGLRLGPWGLVPDYFRLLRARVPPRVERLLVLVADVRDEDTDSVSDALRTIEFKGEARRIKLSRGFVRIWKLAAR